MGSWDGGMGGTNHPNPFFQAQHWSWIAVCASVRCGGWSRVLRLSPWPTHYFLGGGWGDFQRMAEPPKTPDILELTPFDDVGQRSNCNLLRPLIKILFLLVPYGYVVNKQKIPKEMTAKTRVQRAPKHGHLRLQRSPASQSKWRRQLPTIESLARLSAAPG